MGKVIYVNLIIPNYEFFENFTVVTKIYLPTIEKEYIFPLFW